MNFNYQTIHGSKFSQGRIQNLNLSMHGLNYIHLPSIFQGNALLPINLNHEILILLGKIETLSFLN